MQIEWTSSKVCDYCKKECKHFLFDAMTNKIGNPWATMCEDCFNIHAVGILGTGYGQQYAEQKDGRFICEMETEDEDFYL